MDQLVLEIFAKWGTFGIVILGAGWVIYNHIKTNKHTNESAVEKDSLSLKDISNKLDTKSTIINMQIENLSQRIDNIDDNLSNRIDTMHDRFTDKINDLEDQLDKQPKQFINEVETRKKEISKLHTKQMSDLLILGPQLHRVLAKYIEDVNAHHIFVGSFHNGTNSLCGIPYYKFDIIAERFSQNPHEKDLEFAPLYKDVDILRLDRLPATLLRDIQIYFEVDEFGNTKMAELDDIIYRRIVGRGVRSIAINLLTDHTGKPSGFVGVVRYDEEKINLAKLTECSFQLEELYHKNEIKHKI